MVGSDMDKARERAGDLKRSGGRFFSSSPAKRQQRALSGFLIPPSPSPSPSPSGGRVGGEGDAMERWKKERVKGLRWSSSNNEEGGGGSEGEEGYIFRPPLNTNSLSSRKRVKLQGKVPEDFNAVDPAVVPRRLRSAINKRSSQSASPPLSDSKRKQQHASNGTQVSNGCSGERFKQMLHNQVTKDEEEVAEALTALSSLITVCKPTKIKEDRRMLEENSGTKATTTSPSEATKEEGMKFLLPCNDTEATKPSSCVEESHEETMTAEPSALDQPVAASISQKSDAEANEASRPDSHRTPLLSNNEQAKEITSLRDATNSSASPLGTSLDYFSGNRVLQPTHSDALSVCNPEIGLWPLGSASAEHDLQSVKQKTDSGAHYISRKETTSDVRPGLYGRAHGHLTMSSSSKAAACLVPTTAVGRPSSTRNDLPTEKLPLPSADRKRPWNMCAAHVYISHLIQNYQNTETKHQSSLPVNQSKAKEGTISSVHASSGTVGLRNGMVSSVSNSSLMERNMLEARTRMLQDGGLLQAQPTLSGSYAQQKQGYDFLSVPAAGETKNSWNGVKSSGQLHVPYLPHHSVMPIPFPRGPYNTSNYQDQLAAAATQQVQLQLPHFVGSSPLYGPHMVHASATKQQQQQQMWHAHMAYYRPPLGFPKWQQNGRQHDSSSLSPSLISCAQSPPTIFPLPTEIPQGGAYLPPNAQQHFLLPIPSSSSSLPSRTKQQHQHNGGGLSPKHSSQLQMLCNAEAFR